MLTWLPTGEGRVFVDSRTLGADWRGWTAAADGHVLGAADVVRRADGHDAALPVCTERVDSFLRRRVRADVAVTSGEAVTLGVSLVRALAEIGDDSTTGDWWLTEGGRPVLATGVGDQSACDATVALLGALRTSAETTIAAHAVWDRLITTLSGPRVAAAEFAAAESTLFALAAPEPLATVLPVSRLAQEASEPARGAMTVLREPEPSTLGALARFVDADLADTFSRATTAVWRRLRTRPAPRRAPLLVGGAVAVAVLGAGVLWPGAGGPATAGSDTPAASVPGAATPTVVASPEEAIASPTSDAAPVAVAVDPTDVVQDLLDRRLACADEACLAGVLLDPGAAVPPGIVDLPSADRSITELDDLGGMIVLRVDHVAGGGDPQLVVIQRVADRWLLRDVHDVGQQP